MTSASYFASEWHRLAAVPLSAVLIVLSPLASFAAERHPAASAWRPEDSFVQVGRAADATAAAAGLVWPLAYEWRVAGGRLSAYAEASVGRWLVDDGTRGTVTQLGATPVVRWWFGAGERWFAELGVGLNLLAPVYRTRNKRFSTAFNFGDHLALGCRLRTGWAWSVRLQHFSNAGIERPNPGEDFLQLRLAMPID